MDNDVQDTQDFQEQGRRTWATEPHPALSRGVELVRDLTKANEILDERLDEHKRALFYGDDRAEVLRGSGGEDYLLSQLEDDEWDLLHAALGLGTEAGEAMEAVKPVIAHGEEPDVENLKEELGDILYYAARLADVLDTTLLEAMQANNRKLKERFPGKFTQEDALERDTDAEMEAVSNEEQAEGKPGELIDLARVAVEAGWRVTSVTLRQNGGIDEFSTYLDRGVDSQEDKSYAKAVDIGSTISALPRSDKLVVVRAMADLQPLPEA